MTLQQRLSLLITSIGADIKALYAQRGTMPTVETFADLPTSVPTSTAVFYYVKSDSNNQNASGVNQASVYALIGSTKTWLYSAPSAA